MHQLEFHRPHDSRQERPIGIGLDVPLSDGVPMIEETLLDADVLSALCRRSRRRLRDIEARCQVTMKIDRLRCVLRTSGSEASIRAALRQIACMSGQRKSVAVAVWAELMRTRTIQQPGTSKATIARLQQQSGCRVHIERSRCEVRLFGVPDGIDMASRLIDELEDICTEEPVHAENVSQFPMSTLEAFARRGNVTLCIEEDSIIVRGLTDAAARTAEELRAYVANPQSYPPLHVAETFLQDAEHGGEVNMHLGIVTTRTFSDSPAPQSTVPAKSQSSNLPENLDWRQQQQQQQQQQQHKQQQKQQKHVLLDGCSTCPTCGTPKFCVYCGASLWQLNKSNSPTVAQHMHTCRNAGASESASGSQNGAASSSMTPFPGAASGFSGPVLHAQSSSATNSGGIPLPMGVPQIGMNSQHGGIYMVPSGMMQHCMMPVNTASASGFGFNNV
mmetsp:Transcript_67335/g.130117  ORF Transcript_67335/g.130117 Transcript_67335/m.130117 type:complete len:446 (+) Transcript_67335:106-1443(+)